MKARDDADTTPCTVTELAHRVTTRREEEDHGISIVRRFAVRREGGGRHVVEAVVSHSGAFQAEWCDCKGYRFRGDCRHIRAVYDAGMMVIDPYS